MCVFSQVLDLNENRGWQSERLSGDVGGNLKRDFVGPLGEKKEESASTNVRGAVFEKIWRTKG